MFRADLPEPNPSRPVWLIALMVFALAGRLAFVLSLPVDESAMARSLPDQREYLDLGRNLLKGEGLRMIDPRFGDEVRAFRTAGYPLLVAAAGGDVKAIRVVQCLIDVSTVLAAYLLARRWLMPGPATAAAGLVAINPFLTFFCSLILTETVFTALLAWSVALLAMAGDARRRRRRLLFWSGALLAALAIHLRPSAVALPVILGVTATIAGAVSRRMGRFTVPIGAAMLILTAAVLLPWALRNRTILGAWVWTSTNSGFSLYDGLNPDADGSSDQSFVARLPQLQTMNEVARSRYLAAGAWGWAGQNPGRAIELAGWKLARMWSPVPLSAEYGGKTTYALIAAAYAGPLFLLVILGLRRKILPGSAKALLVMPAIYLSLSHAVTVGSLRYRVPAEPMLAVLAASTLVRSRPAANREALDAPAGP